MNDEELKIMLHNFLCRILVTIETKKTLKNSELVPEIQRFADDFKMENMKTEEKILDWNQMADGVLVRLKDWPKSSPSELYLKQHHSVLKEMLRFDTEHRNAWSGGECPLPEGVLVRLQLRGSIPTPDPEAKDCRWRHNGGSDDIIAYRVIGLAPGYVYPE